MTFGKNKIFYAVVVLLLLTFEASAQPNLLVATVATNATDGLNRLVHSLQHFGYTYEVLGMGDKWIGGDVQRTIGGGQKINILRKFLETSNLKNDDILLYIDGYDVIVNGNSSQLIEKFLNSKMQLIFSAEHFCWPDPQLKEAYSPVKENESRFLNSGGFIGFVEFIRDKMLGSNEVPDDSDDQLFYTNYYLEHFNTGLIGLDVRSDIFQNLNGAQGDISIVYVNEFTKIKNNKMETFPMIIHGNGPTKIILNRIGNYIGGTWSPGTGCTSCDKHAFDLLSISKNKWPRILIYVMITEPMPFINEFLSNLRKQTYPEQLIHLLIHNTQKRWDILLNEFAKINEDAYASIDNLPNTTSTADGFMLAKSACHKFSCDYMLLLDGKVQLFEDESLLLLIGLNRSITSPILRRENTIFANFWGAISREGFYDRADDYLDIVNNKRIGIWNVPFVSSCILFKQTILSEIEVPQILNDKDFDMALCAHLRGKGIFMWASNIHRYGILVNNENHNSKSPHPELYETFDNPTLWKKRYLHPQFIKFFDESQNLPQQKWIETYMKNEDVDSSQFYIREPCPDVFWFPLFSEKFAVEMINTCEASNMWSLGKHQDERIPGGYENVPTDDIHMKQLEWQDHWMHFLASYIEPVQKRIFLGYHSNPLRAPLSFVVRYDKAFQDKLRPHHDASTYTLDIALNRYGQDYTVSISTVYI
ncbi:hypothetical protein GJ496_005508 [Pomphorhynchus laevis]|nr:hypothetical protein GJ496_005508 [Pomphorhynchus laevis]